MPGGVRGCGAAGAWRGSLSSWMPAWPGWLGWCGQSEGRVGLAWLVVGKSRREGKEESIGRHP